VSFCGVVCLHVIQINESAEETAGHSTHHSSSHLDSNEHRKRGAAGTAGDGDGSKKIKFNTSMAAPKGQSMYERCVCAEGRDYPHV
jgi:hypothetical protein